MGHKTSNRYIEALKKQRIGFALIFIFSGLISVLMLTGSIYMLQVYDRVLSSGSMETLVGLFAIVVVLYLFFGLFDLLRQRLLSRIAMRLNLELGCDSFIAQIQRENDVSGRDFLPLKQLGLVRQFLSGPTAANLFDLPFVPLFLGVLFILHPVLGLIVLAGAIIEGLAAIVGRVSSRQLQQESARQTVLQNEFAAETFRKAETAVAMGMQQNLGEHWQTMQLSNMAIQQRVSNIAESLVSFSKTFRVLLQSSILTVGAVLVLKDQISAGMIIASSILSGRALAPIDHAIGQWRAIADTALAHQNLQQFFETVRPKTKHIQLPNPTGRITVKSLSKIAAEQGAGRQEFLLNNLNFTLEPGDGLGVIGRSAAGKSVLARLLVGAWQPDRGEVQIDGAAFNKWDPGTIGRYIGYLPQKVTLLPGTISQNIGRFDPAATDADIIAAAQLAKVHDLILRLPNGYATRVGGASGTRLSGGQVQRIALARAVLFRPVLVVLDEPNAHLDGAGDDALEQAIRHLRAAGSTVIVMTHRPSAIAALNKIMVLDQGRITRFDTKENVLEQTGSDQEPSKVRHLTKRTR